jgi:tRNA(adenine34) deaminase
MIPDRELMEMALEEARCAMLEDEVPVGAVLSMPDGRIYRAHNTTSASRMPQAHAEHIAIEAAARGTGDWRLEGSVLATTVEPCLMCGGLCVLARVGRIVFGAPDPRFGAFGSVADILGMQGLNHYPEVSGGLLGDEAAGMMQSFFRMKRSVP